MDTMVVILINLISLVFLAGMFYSAVNTRLNRIEKDIEDQKNFGDRLTKIETSLNFIIQKLETK